MRVLCRPGKQCPGRHFHSAFSVQPEYFDFFGFGFFSVDLPRIDEAMVCRILRPVFVTFAGIIENEFDRAVEMKKHSVFKFKYISSSNSVKKSVFVDAVCIYDRSGYKFTVTVFDLRGMYQGRTDP